MSDHSTSFYNRKLKRAAGAKRHMHSDVVHRAGVGVHRVVATCRRRWAGALWDC